MVSSQSMISSEESCFNKNTKELEDHALTIIQAQRLDPVDVLKLVFDQSQYQDMPQSDHFNLTLVLGKQSYEFGFYLPDVMSDFTTLKETIAAFLNIDSDFLMFKLPAVRVNSFDVLREDDTVVIIERN